MHLQMPLILQIRAVLGDLTSEAPTAISVEITAALNSNPAGRIEPAGSHLAWVGLLGAGCVRCVVVTGLGLPVPPVGVRQPTWRGPDT